MEKEIKKSDEEEAFEWWLEECIQHGLVSEFISQPDPFKLSDPVRVAWHKAKKKTTEIKTQTLMHGHEYTTDYMVRFTPKAYPMLIDQFRKNDERKYDKEFVTHNLQAFVEIKGGFDYQNMTRLAMINAKWVYDKYGIIINIIKIPDLFKITFTPKRYMVTKKTGKARKINFTVRTIEELLH